MNSFESGKLLLAASGGDTVKLFDMSLDAQNQCVLTYSPSPGITVNSVKWNHNNMVLASAGDDGKVSLWKKNGRSLWTVPDKNGWGVNVEPSESISNINFCNKASRYLCSGGTGQVVRVWDLQNKRCVKWLKGHSDAITGVMYNCKDEHIASVSRNGDLIVHSLASGARATELKDPNGQVLGALDYSRMSRHLLVTAGDDGSVHLWDTTTGRTPKLSWLEQHSAPTSGVSFAPSTDKVIASVGLDKKLYIFDTGSRKPSSCIPYEAPFSSLAFRDDKLTVAAGTTTGQVLLYDIRGKPQPLTIIHANYEAILNLCWQNSKSVTFNENNCTDEMILLAGDIGDSSVMPDPHPSRSSNISMPKVVSGFRYPSHASSYGHLVSSSSGSYGSTSTALSLSASEKLPTGKTLLTGLTLARLHAPQGHNVKDDMDVFSPLVEVQPLTPSTLDKLWDDNDGSKNDQERKQSFLFPSQTFGLPEKARSNDHPIFDLKSNSVSKQDDIHSTFSQSTSNFASTHTNQSTSVAPPKAWGVSNRFLEKFIHRKSMKMPSRFSMSTSSSSSSSRLQDALPTGESTTSSLTSDLSLANLRSIKTSHQEISSGSSEALSSPLGSNKDGTLSLTLSPSRRFSSYAERIGGALSVSETSPLSVGSPKYKKTGLETREELLNSLLGATPSTNEVGSPKFKKTGLETGEELLNSLLSNSQTATGNGVNPSNNGETQLQQNGETRLQDAFLQRDSQQRTFTLEPFQHKLEEILSSFQESIHEDMRNLHLEILKQFHMHEMEMSSVMRLILENQDEVMKEIKSLRKETQHLGRFLGTYLGGIE